MEPQSEFRDMPPMPDSVLHPELPNYVLIHLNSFMAQEALRLSERTEGAVYVQWLSGELALCEGIKGPAVWLGRVIVQGAPELEEPQEEPRQIE